MFTQSLYLYSQQCFPTLVHGEFGEDADDNGYKDTRWVLLSDILNLSARDLKVVVTYEKTLNKRQDNKRRALEVASDEE